MRYRDIRKHIACDDSTREQERERIASEIHDELGQYLAILRLEVSLLGSKYGDGNAALQEDVAVIKERVDMAISSVRDISRRLSPAIASHGLIPALEWLLDMCCRVSGLICFLNLPETHTLQLPIDLITDLFRIAQGALTNVVRHAQAKCVEITINSSETELLMVIQDDGKGFDSRSQDISQSFGLISMRRRAMRWGGAVLIDESPEGGVHIEVRIPLGLEIHD